MTVILIIGYIIAGMIVCGLFYYLDSDHEDSPALILVGLAWPVIIMLCLILFLGILLIIIKPFCLNSCANLTNAISPFGYCSCCISIISSPLSLLTAFPQTSALLFLSLPSLSVVLLLVLYAYIGSLRQKALFSQSPLFPLILALDAP